MEDFRELEESVKAWLTIPDDIPFSAEAEKHIEQLFSARIKAAKWFAGHQMHIEQLYSSAEKTIGRSYDFKQDTLAYLHDNVRFAMRTARRIVEGVSNQIVGGIDLDQITQGLDPKHLSFKQFQTLLVLMNPPQGFLQIFLHFMQQSFMLEYAIIAATEVMDHPQQYEEAKITDLSWFIVDTAQEAGASAVRLGIVKSKPGSDRPDFSKLSEEEMRQEQQLAETGFEDWAKNLE